MLKITPPTLSVSALNELKDYLRITLSQEDALLLSLLRSSMDICANFIGTPILLTQYEEDFKPAQTWQALSKSPVIMITDIMFFNSDGNLFVASSDQYEIDIRQDGKGCFRSRYIDDATRISIIYRAGLSEDWSSLDQQLQNAIIRLAGHFYKNRNADDDMAPPSAIAALLQPYRRMRLT